MDVRGPLQQYERLVYQISAYPSVHYGNGRAHHAPLESSAGFHVIRGLSIYNDCAINVI